MHLEKYLVGSMKMRVVVLQMIIQMLRKLRMI